MQKITPLENFYLKEVTKRADSSVFKNILFVISGDIDQGFMRNMVIYFRFMNNENGDSFIKVMGFLPSSFLTVSEKTKGDEFIKNYVREQGHIGVVIDSGPPNDIAQPGRSNKPHLNLDFHKIFDGVFYDDDDGMEDIVYRNTLKLFLKMIKKWQPEVEAELNYRKTGKRPSMSAHGRSIIVDSLT